MKVSKLFRYLINPQYRFAVDDAHGRHDKWPDEKYIVERYKAKFGVVPDLTNPQSFNEKLQWLKLHDRNPEYSVMVDKYEAKEYVASRIGKEHIIPTYSIYDTFDDIDFEALPNQFVLKCTHDSGGLVICRDKSSLDIEMARKKIEESLHQNYYLKGREWPYKNVKPRIIAEKYMHTLNSMTDYKIYCFNGVPKFLYVSKGMEDHKTAQVSYLSLDWKFAPFQRTDYQGLSELPTKPVKFDDMLEYSALLSKETKFLRCDFYEIDDIVLFSELTFFPNGGFNTFNDEEWDKKIGNLIQL